jgi:uncharacterized protein YgiM (DUF1202 family)
MKYKDPSPSMINIWRVTGVVAVILLIFTVILVVKVQTGSSAGFTGLINNQSTTVYLRNHPAYDGDIVAILNPGTAVDVDRSTTREDITWYHVQTESGSGWIPETNLNLSAP